MSALISFVPSMRFCPETCLASSLKFTLSTLQDMGLVKEGQI